MKRLRPMPLDDDQMGGNRAGGDAAIRECGGDTVLYLDVFREGGDICDVVIAFEDVHLAVRDLQDVFAHGEIMAEAVAPVA